MNKLYSSMLLASVSAICAVPAYGQDTPDRAAETRGIGVADIVVTAQRREERLQDVPVSIQALDSNMLEQRGVDRTFDLPTATPGLSINRNGHVMVTFLRGIGNDSIVVGSEASIATYIDGVYQAFTNSSMLALNNVARIEILRGPQGTLFGRNATGGLIQIVTKTPTNDPTAKIEVGYGRFNTKEASAYVSGGFGIVAADFAVRYEKQSDGWGRNLFDPSQAGNVLVNGVAITVPDVSTHKAGLNEDFAISSKFVISPSDALQLKLSAMYGWNHTDQGLYRNYLPGSQALITQAGVTVPYTHQGGFWDYNSNTRADSVNKQLQLAADLSYETDFATLRSISSYQDAVNDPVIYSPMQPLVESPGAPQNSKARQPSVAYTQEFQLLSNSDSSVDWIVGAFYSHITISQDPLPFSRGNDIQGGYTRFIDAKNRSFAFFGQATFDLGPETRVTGGLRYTKDKISAEQYFRGDDTTTVPLPSIRDRFGSITNVVPLQSSTSDNLSYRISVDHHFNPDIMIFASLNTGYKSGNYNTGSLCAVTVAGECPASAIPAPLKPEKITAYEIGFKSDLFDRRARFNVSAFRYDFKEMQVQTLVGTPLIAILENAASARIYGVDAELEAVLSENVSINAAVEYLDAKIRDYPNATYNIARTVFPFGMSTGFITDANGNLNAAGKALTRAPKWSGTFGVNMNIPTGDESEITGNVNVYYNGGFWWDIGNTVKQSSYALLNAEIGYAFNKNVTVKLWGRNITQTKYYSFVNPSVYGLRAAAAAPATYGVKVLFEFN